MKTKQLLIRIPEELYNDLVAVKKDYEERWGFPVSMNNFLLETIDAKVTYSPLKCKGIPKE